MSYDENIELINGYNAWVTQRKLLATDLTPEAYLKDKMKQDAANTLFKAVEYIEDTFGSWNEGNGWYENIEGDDMQAHDMRNVELILRGEL